MSFVQEVELLRQELETYESRLVSKEQAIHILKQQVTVRYLSDD